MSKKASKKDNLLKEYIEIRQNEDKLFEDHMKLRKEKSKFSVDTFKLLIADALFESGLISKELYIKCNPVLNDLPGDLSSIDGLKERMDYMDSELADREKILDDAEYRLGVKQRDIDRISKRMVKHYAKMEKAQENIDKESDKIVKDIDKLDTKLKSLDLSDPNDKSLKDSINSRLDKFKKAHNNFFDKDMTPNNLTGYESDLDTLDARGTDLHNILVDLYNGGMINKTDLNRGDISKNIDRIRKNITNFRKASEDYVKDGQRIDDNFQDMDYIIKESKKIENQMNALDEEYDHVLQTYLDKGGDTAPKPGWNRNGVGTRVDEFTEEMEKLQRDLGKPRDAPIFGFPS